MKKNEQSGNITHAAKVNERAKALEVLEKAKKTQGKITFLRQGASKDFKPKDEA